VNANLVTPAGFAKLTTELELLRARRDLLADVSRPTSKRAESGMPGDSLAASEEVSRLNREITALEERLASVTIVRPHPSDGRLEVGERARVRDLDTGESMEYRIVGAGEADPGNGCISYGSPVGSALLGRRVGDVIEVHAPRGVQRLQVLEIEF
jgi:transcription elongation factor GreA